MELPRIYLDHAATTPLAAEVREAMAPWLGGRSGNASSLHAEGRAAREALEAARETVRRALNAREFRVAFTGGGTEADGLAVLGALLGAVPAGGDRGGRGGARPRAVATSVEHAAVLSALESAGRMGFAADLIPVDGDGRVDLEALERTVIPGTAVVSVMAANNEVGTLQPLEEAGAIARACGAALHVDAVQALGKVEVDLDRLPADIVAISAHKVRGPQGVGALLVRKGTQFESPLRGGGQEDGLRGGTQAVALAVGLALAVEMAVAERPREAPRLLALRERLRRGISSAVSGVRMNTPERGSLPNVLNLSFEGVEGESLVKLLDRAGVAVSTGSACAAGARKASHVLQAMGRSPGEVRGSLRFSLGRSSIEAEVDAAVARVAEAVERLRRLAPVE